VNYWEICYWNKNFKEGFYRKAGVKKLLRNEIRNLVSIAQVQVSINEGSKSLKRKPRKRSTDFKCNQDTDEITTVQVVTAIQRNGDKYLKAVASKRLSKEQIEKALDEKLADNVTLIIDKHPSYKAYAKHPTTKQWCITMLLTDQAYHLFELFKQNAVLIRT